MTVLWCESWPGAALDWPPGGALAWVGEAEPWRVAGLQPAVPDLRDADRHAPALRPAFLRRRLAMRLFLATVLGRPFGSVELRYDAEGRPVLDRPERLFVSTAHRPGLLAFAVARHPVGVDLEPVPGQGEEAEPAWNILTAAERQRLDALLPQERARAFLEIWTAKEAYVKALGLGLWREPAEIDVEVRDAALRLRDRGRRVTATAALFSRPGPPGSAVVAACVALPGS